MAARPSPAVQDYLKAIHALEERGGEAVRTTALAARVGVTPGSATGMVKKLVGDGLVRHRPYRGVELTPEGRRVALDVIRHHRLLELFLVRELGVPWDRVHDEADALEHAVSDQVVELIAAKLGHPDFDPHGDPIPTRDRSVPRRESVPLASLEPGSTGTFVRVSDSDAEMLRFLAERGIGPGDSFEVLEKQPFDGPLSVRFGAVTHVLGGRLTHAMRIEVSE
jgi:DtxR family transcriptional regulator, Mn-dependent transcriptional regulator